MTEVLARPRSNDRTELLTQWLLAQVPDDPGQLVELQHSSDHGNSRCGTYNIERTPLDEVAAGDLASNIIQDACTFADAFTMPQTFQVIVQPSRKSWAFRVEPDVRAGMLAPSEDATEKGVSKFLMRHNESMMRLVLSAVQSSSLSMAARLEKSESALDRLRESRLAELDKVEEIAKRTHENEITRIKVTRSEARSDQLLEKAMAFLPVIGKGIAKKLGAGEAAEQHVELVMLETWFEQLDENEFNRLLAAQDTEQKKMLFLQIWQTVVDRRRAASSGTGLQ